MRSATIRLIASSGILAVLAAGCGDGDGEGEDGDNGENGSGDTSNPVTEEMRSWDGCEVLDDLQPIMDYMQIEAIQGDEGFNSSRYGEGLDQQAATCSGQVTVSSWEYSDGTPRVNDGELWVSIIPWDTEEEAQASYQARSVDDVEAQLGQSSTLQETDRVELGSEWDEGVLLVLEDEQARFLNAYARDGNWLLTVSIRYNDNSGDEYFNENQEILDGTIEDYTYSFDDEELQQWLVDEYVPTVHQDITDMTGQE
ncbi:hypothetical protein [Glycomyces salinus]|uniref:hypothetical protein n=1 Tax=Glycomyces salinus TaxID=980294 RepID=UPI0018ECAA04|nr:hypothetical protein [Glycomyces salinus]